MPALCPTPVDNLPTLAGIQPTELRRIGATLSPALHAMEPGHLLHSALTHPSSPNALHVKSRHPFVPAAQHLISFSDNIRAVQGRITNGMRSGQTAPQDSAFSSLAPTRPEWPSQEESGSGLTAYAPVLDVSAPACTNGVWPPLQPVSVAQKNKLSTMLSSNVQSINLPTDCMAWQFWTMRQLNNSSTPATRSSAAMQWFQ